MELEESTFLTSDYTAKLQSSRQYGTDTISEIQANGTQIESPEINSCTYEYRIFNKRGKDIQWGKDSLFSKWCQENCTATCKRMKLKPFLTPCSKINTKQIKDLNVRLETIKLLEENIGRTLDGINQSKILYDPPPRVMEIKTKINKWDLIKLKSCYTLKETISKVKGSLQNDRK